MEAMLSKDYPPPYSDRFSIPSCRAGASAPHSNYADLPLSLIAGSLLAAFGSQALALNLSGPINNADGFQYSEDVTITAAAGNGISLSKPATDQKFSNPGYALEISAPKNGISISSKAPSDDRIHITFDNSSLSIDGSETGILFESLQNTDVDFNGKVTISNSDAGFNINSAGDNGIVSFWAGLEIKDTKLESTGGMRYSPMRVQGIGVNAAYIAIDGFVNDVNTGGGSGEVNGLESNSGRIDVEAIDGVENSGLITISNLTSNSSTLNGYKSWGGWIKADKIEIAGVHASDDAESTKVRGIYFQYGNPGEVDYEVGQTIIRDVHGISEAAGLANSTRYRWDNYQYAKLSSELLDISDVLASEGSAYGVKSSALDLQISTILIKEIHAESSGDAFGYYAAKYEPEDTENFLPSVFNGSSVQISNVSAANGRAFGAMIDHESDRASSTETQNLSKANTFSVSGVSGSNAYGLQSKNAPIEISERLSIEGIKGTEQSVGLSVEGGSVSIDTLLVQDVGSEDTKRTLVDAAQNALVTFSAADLSFDRTYAYAGTYVGDPIDGELRVSSIALRSVLGARIESITDDSSTVRRINGDLVAGRGSADKAAESGRIQLTGGINQIYGDVYAGNGGSIELSLGKGSILEGQVDDYHELDSTAAGSVFRNATFTDESGNSLDVTTAGQATLRFDGGTWIARGQSFVDTVEFGTFGGTIDLSQNRNSSVSIENLKGNGEFTMELGAYADTGEIVSDMLYIQNAAAGSSFTINAKLGDSVSSIDQLENLRFATVANGASANLFTVKIEDQGFNNCTVMVAQEDYVVGDTDNERFNGESSGEGVYKPGETAVDAIYGNNSAEGASVLNGDAPAQNYFISGVAEGGTQVEISDAGETILGTARATYWNAVILDRWNQRYGERTYDADHHGVWARVKHERLGTDAGIGDFRSYNTMYQFGYDYAKPTENGRMIWGGAIDYMDGRTDYRSISGNGGTDRSELSLYATYLGENGFYGDLVLRAGKLSNDFEMTTPSGTALDADYDSWFFGASFETGRQLENGTGWFIEPQAQIQYLRIASGDYSTTQTKVEQDAIDSLIGRAGFRVGKFLSDDKAQTAYFKADVLREFMGEQKIRVFDRTTRAGGDDVSISNHGTWFDAGAGFQAVVTKDFYAYGDLEYRFGNDLWNTWVFNIGAKYRF